MYHNHICADLQTFWFVSRHTSTNVTWSHRRAHSHTVSFIPYLQYLACFAWLHQSALYPETEQKPFAVSHYIPHCHLWCSNAAYLMLHWDCLYFIDGIGFLSSAPPPPKQLSKPPSINHTGHRPQWITSVSVVFSPQNSWQLQIEEANATDCTSYVIWLWVSAEQLYPLCHCRSDSCSWSSLNWESSQWLLLKLGQHYTYLIFNAQSTKEVT